MKQAKSQSGDKKQRAAKRASHDASTPQALTDFMLSGWKDAPPPQPRRQADAEHFAGRRRALSRCFPGDTLVIPSGCEKTRNADAAYRFRTSSDFYYLTGIKDSDCVLVMSPRGRSGHRDTLFVHDQSGRDDASFFTDRHRGELWVGRRMNVQQTRQHTGMHAAACLTKLPERLAQIKKTGDVYRVLRDLEPWVDKALRPNKRRDGELAAALGETRLVKDAGEVKAIAAACKATKSALEDLILALKNARTERDLECAFDARARRLGNGVGYNTIVAAGANACVLHWTNNDARLRKRDLVLVDAGVEGEGLYTADITRTLPISGKFSPSQRRVYDIVIKAQDAAFEAIRPGADFLAPNRAAMKVLTDGLVELGLLPGGASEALKPENQFYRRYTLHGVSHMLGLDVHDCGKAPPQLYRRGTLTAGMVLTVEPGLYFQPDDLTVPKQLRGIGIRIEDDILVTEKGCRLLSKQIPRLPDDVEAWMASVHSR